MCIFGNQLNALTLLKIWNQTYNWMPLDAYPHLVFFYCGCSMSVFFSLSLFHIRKYIKSLDEWNTQQMMLRLGEDTWRLCIWSYIEPLGPVRVDRKLKTCHDVWWPPIVLWRRHAQIHQREVLNWNVPFGESKTSRNRRPNSCMGNVGFFMLWSLLKVTLQIIRCFKIGVEGLIWQLMYGRWPRLDVLLFELGS